MKYRDLGATGIKVSEIGFGAWGIGGRTSGNTSYGETDDNDSLKALGAAFDQGVTFYDTSSVYGDGRSEELIRQALHQSRDQIVIATKCGYHTFDRPKDFSAENIRASLEGSLCRLRTGYIDLYMLHGPDVELLRKRPEIVETLLSLKSEGKVRAVGLSANTPRDGYDAICEFPFDAVQMNLNMTDQRALECGLVDKAKQNGVALIARTPLCFGLLTGKWAKDATFDEPDHRSTWPREQIERWVEASNRFVESASRRDKQTPAQLALRYCLSVDGVSSVIPGMLHEREVLENVVASDLGPLSQTDLDKINNIYGSENFFIAGKNRPPAEPPR